MNEKLELKRVPTTPIWELTFFDVPIGRFQSRAQAEEVITVVEAALDIICTEYDLAEIAE